MSINAETYTPAECDWLHLQFNENGKFEIMIIADIQIGNYELDHATIFVCRTEPPRQRQR